MKKKILAVLLSVMISMQAGAVSQAAYTAPEDTAAEYTEIINETANSGICGENVSYNLYGDGELVISGSGEMYSYSPSESAPWYSERASVKTVTIEAGVASVGDYAFSYCNNLTNVNLPDGIENIGSRAFCGCEKLVITSLPESVKTIGDGAFGYCSQITELKLPESVSAIGSRAFYSCTGLEELRIPAETADIADDAFIFCAKLQGFSVAENNNHYSSDEYGVLFNKDKTELLCCAAGAEMKNYKIPGGVKKIGNYAFFDCAALSGELVLPEGLTSVGNSAFSGCKELHGDLYIPGSVSFIGNDSFADCTDLSGTVYFGADRDSWDAVVPDNETVGLGTALVHYNCKRGETHSYDRVVTTEATCDKDGVVSCMCECGYVMHSEVIHAKGHNYVGKITKKSTCSEEGIKTFTCENCGDVYTESLPKTAHRYIAVKGSAATCTSNGMTDGIECSECGAVLSGHEVIPAAGHNYEIIKGTPATCEKDGLTTGVICSVCGDAFVEQKVIPATGHNYKSEFTRDVSCLDYGIETFTCENCGDTVNKIIPATGHSFAEFDNERTRGEGPAEKVCVHCGYHFGECLQNDGANHIFGEPVIVKEANCCEDGLIEYQCTLCGETETETIERDETKHTDENHDAVCDDCDEALYGDCDCDCHNGAKRVIFKILRFFWKLFGMNNKRFCSCGAAHW